MGVMHPCTYPGCIKKFDRKYNLKCHLRIHSNEKPYRCHHQNCTRSFRWKSSLNHHLMSLDHTPAAVRRARKASAQRRRIHNNTAQTFVPQPQQQHLTQHPVYDLPNLSPVSSAHTYSHSPSPQHRPISHLPHPQSHFKLDQPFSPSETLAQELHYINTNVSHSQPDQSVPTIQTTASLYSHTPYKLSNPVLRAPHRPQPHHSIIAQLQDPLAVPVKPLQNPLISDTSLKHHLRPYDYSAIPRSTSDQETSLHIPADDTISLVTPTKKTEPLEFTSSNKLAPPDPLVSISFEDLSPVSLMPFPSSLDSLFPANVDPSAMKSF